ncbi:hypothetical protein D1632_10700 [Chryseobacterium nematophagum]|uniref:Uncharacterized protein n=1 Tax=Chryseobacterium nematophagum TaxID=2305228 RepID=A0A3M7LEZ9_9FLAO|nr:hypothetical protein [Chryseobacterium nematophagum]RMZ60052.1 hypothetical protein D1632_10700 [Chryseobacterium nematophagum]
MNINDYVWHDKVLLNINIDRKKPGIIDEVSFEIEDNNVLKKLIFKEVYWLNLNLNFGVIAEESILNIQCLNKDDYDLSLLYKKWNGHLDEKKLHSYLIELNSSGSTIKLIAENFIYQNLN